MLRLHKERVSE